MTVGELKKELEKYPDEAFLDIAFWELDSTTVTIEIVSLKPGTAIMDKKLGELEII